MNVNAASNASDLWKLMQSSQTASASGVSSITGANGSSSVTSASGDGSSLSSAAKLFSTLHTLSESNPAEFKKISAQIAAQLQQAASSATGTAQASALNELAAGFQKAAQTGQFSDLFSQSGSTASTSHAGGHHSHYHSHNDGDGDATSSSASAAGQSTSDPVNAIFSQALSQIQTDLKSSLSATAVSI